VREARRTFVELRVRPVFSTAHDGDPRGRGVRDELEQIREIELGHYSRF
jgi:hypothetical protein